jgi:hypothetical protein
MEHYGFAEIKNRLDISKASETKFEVATDGSRADKKRPRQHLAASSPLTVQMMALFFAQKLMLQSFI